MQEKQNQKQQENQIPEYNNEDVSSFQILKDFYPRILRKYQKIMVQENRRSLPRNKRELQIQRYNMHKYVAQKQQVTQRNQFKTITIRRIINFQRFLRENEQNRALCQAYREYLQDSDQNKQMGPLFQLQGTLEDDSTQIKYMSGIDLMITYPQAYTEAMKSARKKMTEEKKEEQVEKPQLNPKRAQHLSPASKSLILNQKKKPHLGLFV